MQTKTMGKRNVISVLLCIIMLLSSMCSTAFAETISEGSYRYYANGVEYVPEKPLIKVDNEIYVPVRLIAESMGMTASWDASSKEISFEMSGNTLKMKIDSDNYTYNGVSGNSLQKPLIYNQRTYVPLKLIAVIFGFTLVIDENTKRIDVYQGTYVHTETYTLYANDTRCYTDTPVFKDGDEYWISMRDFSTAGRFEIKWDVLSQEIWINDSNNAFCLRIDTGDYTFNNTSGKMSLLPRMEFSADRNNVYLPLKFMSLLFGIPLDVDEVNKTVKLSVNTDPSVDVSGLEIYNTDYEIDVNVKPRLVTRGELSRFLVKSFGLDSVVVPTQVYSDVTSENEYFKDIYIVKEKGLMAGYVDGTFRPELNMTRAEYACLLYRALKYNVTKNKLIINDITNHWAQEYIKTVVDAGLMEPNADNCFEPNKFVSIDLSGQIIPVISPVNADNKKVIWKSDNEKVAVVDKTGHINGFSPGKAVITCTTVDGKLSKTFGVSVKEPVIYGYIKPDLTSDNENICSGFKIEFKWTKGYVITDTEGYFKMGCEKLYAGDLPVVTISKPGYLTRTFLVDYFGELSSKESPLIIWPGDIDGDNCINMMDIMEIAKAFNSTAGDVRFRSECDFDLNGAVNLADVVCAAKRFNTLSDNYNN